MFEVTEEITMETIDERASDNEHFYRHTCGE